MPDFKALASRVSMAYDLCGDGKTALKFNGFNQPIGLVGDDSTYSLRLSGVYQLP